MKARLAAPVLPHVPAAPDRRGPMALQRPAARRRAASTGNGAQAASAQSYPSKSYTGTGKRPAVGFAVPMDESGSLDAMTPPATTASEVGRPPAGALERSPLKSTGGRTQGRLDLASRKARYVAGMKLCTPARMPQRRGHAAARRGRAGCPGPPASASSRRASPELGRRSGRSAGSAGPSHYADEIEEGGVMGVANRAR